jgi:hypothetical protein
MYAHVLCQIALLRKRSSTNFAFERSLTSMRAKMSCQSLCARTRFIARATHVWCDEHVSSRVQSQTAFITKRFITHSAFERLLARMRAKMNCQIPGTRTRFIARSTHEWSDEHVSSRVLSQMDLLSKRFITHSAFERLLARVYTLVSFQMLSSRKIFIADFADICSSSPSSSFFENSVVVVSIWNF